MRNDHKNMLEFLNTLLDATATDRPEYIIGALSEFELFAMAKGISVEEFRDRISTINAEVFGNDDDESR